MPHFAIVYFGGNQPSDPNAGKQNFAKYMERLKSLGDAALSPANPLKSTKTAHPDGSVTDGSGSATSGYTIIDAETTDSAVAIAKACPFLEIGGSLEVSELVQMQVPKQMKVRSAV